MSEKIVVRGAREHNLKNVSLEIPRDSLVVFTGVSGSGKSSLAFDTIFQEGQRRYIESLSAYARQFIGTMKTPDVEHVHGLSPTISIDQKTVNRNPRSTVGTVTDLYDHFRLLYARLGIPHCPDCGEEICARSVASIVDTLIDRDSGRELLVLAPLVRDRKGEYRKELEEIRSMGYARVRVDGTIHRSEEKIVLKRYEKHSIEIVVDRIRIEKSRRVRLTDSIETALRHTKKLVAFRLDDREERLVATDMSCPQGHVSVPELEPRLFSFNAPQGACPHCKGLGYLQEFHEDMVVPNGELSVNQGAIAAQMPAGNIMFSKFGQQELEILAGHYGFSLDTPWNKLKKNEQKILLHGSPDVLDFILRKMGKRKRTGKSQHRHIRGVISVLQRVWNKWHIGLLNRFMKQSACDVCNGTRLNPVAMAVDFRGRNIHEISCMTVEDSLEFFSALRLEKREEKIGREILREIRSRLGFLEEVGLGYLGLHRSAATLSGGESQRIRLATQVGAGLQGVLYVLDEPSIGLHPRDNGRMLDVLERLRLGGNSLIVVEHDEETMLRADLVVDIGPGAGIRGGEIVAADTVQKLLKNPQSPTGQYLSGKREIEIPAGRRSAERGSLEIFGATRNNLKNVNVAFPVGCLTVVTGVSGSGKSSLINGILRPVAVLQEGDRLEDCKKRKGFEVIDKVLSISQSPIGRTPRSNPVTYTKIFDPIRDLFAALPESKLRGYKKGRFSFNVKGGRCEECKGSGLVEIDMQILASVSIPCDTCGGRRFNPATLEIHFKGQSITDVLEMSIDEACVFFAAQPRIYRGLALLQRIGLGYLHLGQPSTTLSGGEAQRIKIAAELRKPGTGHTLYLLDEPTTGLHFDDIRRLMSCLQELVNAGNTMVVIEHNLDVVKCADHVIDMGPEGGEGGGELLFSGSPEELATCPESYTGQALAPVLARKSGSPLLPAIRKTRRKKNVGEGPDIVIRGAKKHNLKNVDLEIPRHSFSVITGVSGSGKSSLAFHTLFSEGQRRFVESLSAYARRFLGRIDSGAVESVSGLPPAIAISQGVSNRSPRSTVATVTEIYDYFRLLFARAGTPHCPECARELRQNTASLLADRLLKEHSGEMITLLAPVYHTRLKKHLLAVSRKNLLGLFSRFAEQGFSRIYAGGKMLKFRDGEKLPTCSEAWLVEDRVKLSSGNRGRLVESLEKSFETGREVLGILLPGISKPELHSQVPGCLEGHYFHEGDFDPRNFSFNSHWGACSLCQGLGNIAGSECPECLGERLRPESLAVLVGGLNISELCRLTIDEALDFFSRLKLEKQQAKIAAQVLREVRGRLQFLVRVGLGYISLNRSGDTLSGGEAQRIRLASQIGSGLEGVLYVLDEPTIGLHQQDTQRLVNTLHHLRDLGNTVLAVEHDMDVIRSADHVIDMGPGAGEEGGEICSRGTPEELCKSGSLTGTYLSGKSRACPPSKHDRAAEGWLQLQGAEVHNLRSVDVDIPKGCLTGISGVSGSGKSSLILDALLPLVIAGLEGRKSELSAKLSGVENFRQVLLVDQTPIGTTPRSTPVTFLKVFDRIRDLYAGLPASKVRGYKKGEFSYNRPGGGRCEICEGRGSRFVEMHFLSDVWELCDECGGKRYKRSVLDILFRNKNIADVLEMRVLDACEFFKNHARVFKPLEVLKKMGLGYLRLGQPANTLSGGEAQRLKLSAELARAGRGNTLYLLDEPSTGLHPADVSLLWKLIQELVDRGNTVVFIEHNLDMLAGCDWLVDLGPQGGSAGGQVLYQGDPLKIPARASWPTAKALRDWKKTQAGGQR